MSDAITEARFQLYLALEGVRQSSDPDSIPGTEYAEMLLKSADAYALAVLEAAVLPHDHLLAKTQCESCKGWAKLRARIGQGQSPGE